jgi:16S rRNA (cytosine1402-N4)-methyltransferase
LNGRAAHRPVLLKETVAALAVRPGGRYLDATVGAGGHAEAVLEAASPGGTLVGIDRDAEALALARERLARFGGRVRLIHGTHGNLDAALEPGDRFDGILADLGVSSLQMDRPERGFAFQRPGPLDMRMDASRGKTAREMLLEASTPALEEWLRRAGEGRFSRTLARRLKAAAPGLATTGDLAAAVARWVPRRGPRHPATRVFLAIRMAVNAELEQLGAFLSRCPERLNPGGRLVVIAFHSTEDRRIKDFGKTEAGAGGLRAVFKKPVAAGAEERRSNPRSRSAKLRAFAKEPDGL